MHKTLTLPALFFWCSPLTGCDKVAARVELKKGNALYRNEQYTDALKQFQLGLELDPDAHLRLALGGPDRSRPVSSPATKARKKSATAKPPPMPSRSTWPTTPKTRRSATTCSRPTSTPSATTRRSPPSTSWRSSRSRRTARPTCSGSKIHILVQMGPPGRRLAFVEQTRGRTSPSPTTRSASSDWDKSFNDTAWTSRPGAPSYVDHGLESLEPGVDDEAGLLRGDGLQQSALPGEGEDPDRADAPGRENTAQADEWQHKALALRKKTMAAERNRRPPQSPNR